MDNQNQKIVKTDHQITLEAIRNKGEIICATANLEQAKTAVWGRRWGRIASTILAIAGMAIVIALVVLVLHEIIAAI